MNLYKLGLHNKFSSSSFIEFLRGISYCVQSLDVERTNFLSDAYLHSDFYCSALKEINLFGCDLSLDTIQNMLTKYKDIESISLSLNIRSSSGFLAIMHQLSELRKLKKLKIHNCSLDERHPLAFEASRLRLHQLFKAQNNLESLSFVHCQMPLDLYMIAIDYNPELREISFKMCGKLQADAFKTSDGAALKKLETLNLAGTKCDDHVLKTVAERAPQLKHVYINACGSLVTENGIAFFAERCRCLTTLVISKTRFDKLHLTDAALAVIANSCCSLKYLAVNYCLGIGHLGVVALASGCKLLEDLEIAGCDTLSDDSLQSLVENCLNLRKLNLLDCEQITSTSVNSILVKLRHLRYLDLNNCYRLCDLKFMSTDLRINTEDCRDDIVKDNLSKPESNGVETKQRFTFDEIHSHIFVLSIGYCSKISAECLRQVASFCPDIRELNLQECFNITDQSVELVTKSCKSLTKFNISGGFGNHSTKLTDKSLESLAKWSQKLEHLVILQNPNITINGINAVVVRCPRIDLVSVSTGNRVQIPGLKLAFGKVNTKWIKLDVLSGKANYVDIYVQLNKAVKQTQD